MSKLLNQGKNMVFLDIETTGFSPENSQLIEVALIKVSDFPVGKTENYSTLVHADFIPDKITEITGISASDVEDSPNEIEVVSKINDFIKDANVFVGHNISQFDIEFMKGRGVEFPDNYSEFDTLKYSRALLPELDSHKQTDIAEHFNIEVNDAHRALDDTLVNIQIYQKLSELKEPEGAQRLVEVLDEIEKLEQEKEELLSKVIDSVGYDGTEDKSFILSNGYIVNLESNKKVSFNSAKFRQEYDGDIEEFYEVKPRFNQKLVKDFDKELFDKYVEQVSKKPKVSINK